MLKPAEEKKDTVNEKEKLIQGPPACYEINIFNDQKLGGIIGLLYI